MRDIEDIVRQANIVKLNDETLVYILHGKYWDYRLQIYSSNKEKQMIEIPNIKSVCITPNKKLEIYGTNLDKLEIKRLPDHKIIQTIPFKGRPLWMECFSDSRRLVVMSEGNLKCLDLFTLQTLFVLEKSIPHWS